MMTLGCRVCSNQKVLFNEYGRAAYFVHRKTIWLNLSVYQPKNLYYFTSWYINLSTFQCKSWIWNILLFFSFLLKCCCSKRPAHLKGIYYTIIAFFPMFMASSTYKLVIAFLRCCNICQKWTLVNKSNKWGSKIHSFLECKWW